jgi:hypothetical protein
VPLAALAQIAEPISKADNHVHHTNEIGMAHAPVYFLSESGAFNGLRVHYIH